MSEGNDMAQTFSPNKGISSSSKNHQSSHADAVWGFHVWWLLASISSSEGNRFSAWMDLNKILPGKHTTKSGRGWFIHQNAMTQKDRQWNVEKFWIQQGEETMLHLSRNNVFVIFFSWWLQIFFKIRHFSLFFIILPSLQKINYIKQAFLLRRIF